LIYVHFWAGVELEENNCEPSDATLSNNLVAGNQATRLGSGLYIGGSSPSSLHTTIAQNTGGDGSGVYATDDYRNSCYCTLVNTVLVGHTVGITVAAGNTLTLESTLWHANGPDTDGEGTILTDTVNVHDDLSLWTPARGTTTPASARRPLTLA
jgi:hypothetical protein